MFRGIPDGGVVARLQAVGWAAVVDNLGVDRAGWHPGAILGPSGSS